MQNILSDGQFRLRQIVIPNHDILVNDSIDTWQAGNFAPITFNVNVPENTPADDIVSIQFNPYDWSQPIPMWPLGKNQWTYTFYSVLWICLAKWVIVIVVMTSAE